LSEFEVSTGTWKVSEEPNPTEGQLWTDGDMETAGVGAWSTGNSATLTKETTAPYAGLQSLRVAYGGASSPYAFQAIPDKILRVTGKARGDGTFPPRVRTNGGATVWAGTNSTSWQDIDFTFDANGATSLRLRSDATGAGYAEFDNMYVVEVGEGKKWIENVVAGVAYTKSLQAYGTWIFNLYKGADANACNIAFAATTTSPFTAENRFRVADDESISILVNGATKMATVASYIAINTKYSIAVTKRYDGQFTLYIKGGAYTVWTLVDVAGGTGTNPVTDNTVTTSKYFIFDGDAGDKISEPIFYEGVLTLAQLQSMYP